MSSCRVAENEEKSAVIESVARRKKRGGLDVFQFAETVEPEAWGDRSKDLQVRLGWQLFICPLPRLRVPPGPHLRSRARASVEGWGPANP